MHNNILIIILLFIIWLCRILGSASIPLKNVINSGEQSHTLTGPGEDGAELNVRLLLWGLLVVQFT